jgi:predicted MFS family arabinose efflux permease
MQKLAPPPPPAETRPLWLVVLAAGTIVGVAMGTRQVMGLYLEPVTTGLGIGVQPFSTSLAVANLIWGIGAVFAGMIADRWGAGRVVAGGTVATVAGFYVLYAAKSPFDLMVSGVLLGIGVSGTGITALVGAAGRAAPPEKRTAAIASLGMASGIGGFVAFPYTHLLMELAGWQTSLLLLAATMVAVLPFTLPLSGKPTVPGLVDDQSLLAAFKEALTHRSYILLVIGFFVCGFHVAFIATHLPGVVASCQLPPEVGAWSLAVIGLFNILGSLTIGWAIGYEHGRWRMKSLLSLIYAVRALAVLVFVFAPKTPTTLLVFAAVIGFTYLSTVPPTAGLVARFFGPAHMATLFGVVMLSHQIGGFLGAWLGGKAFEATGSYDWMWWIDIVLAVGAALVHLPIDERRAPLAAGTA